MKERFNDIKLKNSYNESLYYIGCHGFVKKKENKDSDKNIEYIKLKDNDNNREIKVITSCEPVEMSGSYLRKGEKTLTLSSVVKTMSVKGNKFCIYKNKIYNILLKNTNTTKPIKIKSPNYDTHKFDALDGLYKFKKNSRNRIYDISNNNLLYYKKYVEKYNKNNDGSSGKYFTVKYRKRIRNNKPVLYVTFETTLKDIIEYIKNFEKNNFTIIVHSCQECNKKEVNTNLN